MRWHPHPGAPEIEKSNCTLYYGAVKVWLIAGTGLGSKFISIKIWQFHKIVLSLCIPKLKTMETKEISMKELLQEINDKVFQICYESNPIRKGWELHTIEEQDFTIKDNPNFYKNYYLIECYSESLTEAELDLLYGYADGLIQKGFENFMNGRTSLAEQINTSMEDWENRFLKHLEVINGVMVKRSTFLQNN